MMIALKIISRNLGNGPITIHLRGEFVQKVMEKLDENPEFSELEKSQIRDYEKVIRPVEKELAKRLLQIV